jgi:hypothetical protein
MYIENLIEEGLRTPPSALTYSVSRSLTSLFPDKAILGTADSDFDLPAYAAAGQCSLSVRSSVYSHFDTYWSGAGCPTIKRPDNAWFEIFWRGHRLEVILLNRPAGGCQDDYHWILADSAEVADQFFRAVCEWGAEIRREILVFQGGYWDRSEELYQAIKGATFDNLILPGSLKAELQADFAQFFQSRATYERYRVPWKRGLLFVGPPGNGKTHAVKALLNSVEYPGLYVKSLKTRWDDDHGSIRRVFARARQTTPCIIVLEDLDSLVQGENRSFFLNELDGFARNHGILTIATTNHPERLDPAIADRPSRFDRKYHFELPRASEREAYIKLWNGELEPEMQLSEAAIPPLAMLTEGFSFAYMKELFLSSMMRWLAAPLPGGMDAAAATQARTLREQMTSVREEAARDPNGDEEAPDDDANGFSPSMITAQQG